MKVKIQFCPICMQELIPISVMTFRCSYCMCAFYISVEYSIDSPWLVVKNDEVDDE